MNFSLFYFASDAAGRSGDKYRLLLEGACFADAHGFEAVWLPERHFNPFGGIFPNPAVVAAGLATITKQVRLRAGSVVLPLHHPARVAEEWSVVDNLSGGRVDISAARGWAKSDRILAPPASTPAGTEVDPFYETLDQIRRLWRGERVSFADASGARSEVAIFPPPLQPELECWATCAQNPKRFVEAGERGLNILTSLIMMPLERLEASLAEYREARKRGGHDPATGKVTLMLHTFLDEDEAAVRRAVEAPFREYLTMSFDAWAGTSSRLGALDERERETIIDYAQERYYRTSALFGSVETCLPLVRRIQKAGVTEISCLIDFGVDPQTVLASLPMIDKLRRRAREEGATTQHGSAAQRTDLLRQLLLKRSGQQKAAPSDAARAGKTSDQAAQTQRHRASLGQQALWLLQQSLPENAAYNTAVSLRILRPADETALFRACQRLCDRHPILRTTYEATADGLFLVVYGHRPLDIERLDATEWDRAQQMDALRQAYARPFDLSQAAARVHVQSLAGGDLLFMLAVHHIARDGISMTILIDDLLALYAAERDGSDPQLPPPGPAFADYVAEERALLDSPEGEELRRKWRTALSGAPAVLDVPGDRPRPAKLGAHGDTVSRTLEGDTVAALREAARATGVTTNGLLCAVYAVLLQRYSGADDMLIGMPAVGRDRARFARTAGYFVNPVPCRASFQHGDAFSDVAARMQGEIARALGAQALPFPEIVRLVDPPRDASRLPLVQFLFGYIRIGPDRPLDRVLLPGAEPGEQEVAGLRLEPALIAQEEGQFDGTLEAIERPDSIHLALKYNTDLYSPDFAAQLMKRYVTLLRSAIAAPQAPVEDLDMLSPDERAQLSARVSPPVTIPDLPIEALVRRQMSETPEALAVRDATRALTFARLGEEVGRLAARLRDGDVAGQVVGVHAEPSVAALVGILAVLEAGGIFLPLDPANPADRLAFMAEDSGATTILTDRPLSWEMPEGPRVVALEPGEGPSGEGAGGKSPTEASAMPPGGAERAAYLLYTSGSTGRPKGVSVHHRSVVNLLLDLRERMPLVPGEVFYSLTALSFDIVIVELFLPLVTGAVLEFAGAQARDPERLRDRLHRGDLRLMQATPTMWRLIVEAGWTGSPNLVAVTAGEALHPSLAEKLRARCERLWNGYGPTEATVYATMIEVTDTSTPGSIGWPLANVDVYVVDRQLRELAPGVCGELLIGGEGVAIGYHDRPALNAERFVPDPVRSGEGRRAYRTGDRVRRLGAGDLLYLGRIDHQLKLGGVRIEPGEIEAVLCTHPSVAHAVVLPETIEDRVRRLVAFWTPADGGREEDAPDLRRYLAQRLPSAMVPARLVAVDAFPSTPSGKLDRLALAAAHLRLEAEEQHVSTGSSESGDGLAAIWRELLGVASVEPEDDFFELGGASLDVIRLVSRARQAGFSLATADIFEHSTLAALERLIAERGPVEPDQPSDTADDSSEAPTGSDACKTEPLDPALPDRRRSRIESIGVYLPEREWETADIMAGCARPPALDLEQLTGIRSRPRAAEDEYSIDLAAKAVERCLQTAPGRTEAIDLLICCNISRYDAQRQITFEPGTAARLRERFGLPAARVFDISNACAGMFTGLKIADLFLRLGLANRPLVVSGEFITHLTETAQREIDGVLDPRMACLTVGDSGVALLLDRATDGQSGFQEIDLFTIPEHSELCIARPSERPEGGAIMLTDSLQLSEVATRPGLDHALALLERHDLTGDACDRFIMHQASSTTIRNAQRELKRLLGEEICTPENTVDNLLRRGNTSSTTHFVALWDEMARGKIKPDQRLMFNISASGLTLGTAIYNMDDLPDHGAGKGAGRAAPAEEEVPRRSVSAAVAGVARLAEDDPALDDTLEALEKVARQCLDDAGAAPAEIDLVLFAGVHRTDFVCEPATATRLARLLSLGAEGGQNLLAFDVFNGGRGFLDACEIAASWLEAGEARHVLVATAEIDPNDPLAGHPETGIIPVAGAVLLGPADPETGPRIDSMIFAQADGTADAARSWCTWDQRGAHLVVAYRTGWEQTLAAGCQGLVADLLEREALSMDAIDFLIPPHPSAAFGASLAAALGLDPGKLVDPSGQDGNLLTGSVPAGLALARARGLLAPGKIGILLAGGAGVLAGAALLRG